MDFFSLCDQMGSTKCFLAKFTDQKNAERLSNWLHKTILRLSQLFQIS